MSLRRILLRALPAFALVFGAASCVVEEVPVDQIPQTPAGSTETVAGTDADSNGVRDDVQAHIQTTYASDASARSAATRLAKAFQTMLVNSGSKTQVLSAVTSLNGAVDCLYSLDASTFANRVEDIEGSVVNTGSRAKAYAKAGAYVSGGTYAVSTTADNSAACGVAP